MALILNKIGDIELNLTLKEGNIYGWLHHGNASLFHKLSEEEESTNSLNDVSISNIPKKNRYTSISYASLSDLYFYTKSVKSEFRFLKEYRNVTFSEDKIIEVLSLVGLDASYLMRDIKTLSYSEKLQVFLALHLILPFDVFILEDIYSIFDLKIQKNIDFILKELKNQNKIVILSLKDVNILYSLTDYVAILDSNKLLTFGKSTDIFTKISFLEKNQIEIPYLSIIPYLAKERKNVKLFNRTDLRDTIKDIYKHV